MNYLKEVSLNDVVSIETGSDEKFSVFTVSKEDKVSFALQLNW
jgi:medium-chain acyl-[acyl-carrier-protein] hydrolase